MDQTKLNENGLFLNPSIWVEYYNEMPQNIKEKVDQYFFNIENHEIFFGGLLEIGHDGEFFYVLTTDGVTSEKQY